MRNFRKALATLSVVAILSSLVVSQTAFAATFNDVPADAYYYEAVEALVGAGVLDGTPLSYYPGVNLKRSEAAKVLVSSAGFTLETPAVGHFDDVSPTEWYYSPIETAFLHNVVNGYTDSEGTLTGFFGPDNLVLRAEFAKMVVEAFNLEMYMPATPTFDDVSESDWFYEYVETAAHHGIVNGYGNGMFGPSDNINRADGAVMAHRAMTGVILPPLPPESVDGNLYVTLSAESPVGGSVPTDVSVKMFAFDLEADGTDVEVTGIKLSAGGLGDYTDINGVVLYHDGNRIGNAKDIGSEKDAQFNLSTPLVVADGMTETIVVKATLASAATSEYSLNILSDADITTRNAAVMGDFPVEGDSMNGVVVSNIATLTIASDGTPANVDLGDEQATLAKFKLENDDFEDVYLYSVVLKKDSASTANDDDFENLTLTVGGTVVATADSISAKYVGFVFDEPFLIARNRIEKFQVKADIIDGASRTIKLKLDNAADIEAIGDYYGYSAKIAGAFTGVAVSIDAGAVTVVKTNALSDKIRVDKNNVELGTLAVKSNSGQDLEMSTLKLVVTADLVGSFANTDNWEIYNKTNNTTYDLTVDTTDVRTAGAVKVYSNETMDLRLAQGVTNELVVRMDTLSTAVNGNWFEVKLDDAAAGDMLLKELGNDVIVTDITPNSVSLKKVTVEIPVLTFSTNALSAAYSAVVGTDDVKLLSFNVKANETAAVKVTELKFVDNQTQTVVTSLAVDSQLVSIFKLFKEGDTTPLATKTAYQLASEEITFEDLSLMVDPNETLRYYLTTNMVKNNLNDGEVLQYRMSGYTAEDVDEGKDVLASNDDGISGGVANNHILELTETPTLISSRIVTLAGAGILYVSMDNTDTYTDQDIYAVAGDSNGTPYLATLKMRGENEDIKLVDLQLTIGGLVTATPNQIFSALSLYDEAGNMIATESNVTATTLFEGINYVVGQTSEKIYVKATLNKVGMNLPGALDEELITFQVTDINAEGFSTGDDLVDDTNAAIIAGEIAYDGGTAPTAVSKKLGVLASAITNVQLLPSYNGESVPAFLGGGDNNLGWVAITVSNSTNKTAANEAVKLLLDQLVVDFNKESATLITAATLQRVGGAGEAPIAATLVGAGAASTAGTATFNTSTFVSDDEIVPGSTVYYKLIGTVTLGAGTDYVQPKFTSLNATNFSYRDVVGAVAKTALRLDGVSNIDGKKLDENI